MVVLGLTLKVHRILLHPGDHGLFGGAPLLGGEILAYLGFAAASLGWITIAARRRRPWLGIIMHSACSPTAAGPEANLEVGAFT